MRCRLLLVNISLVLLLWVSLQLSAAAPDSPYAQRLQQVVALNKIGLWQQALQRIGELERINPAPSALGRLWFLRGTLAQNLRQTEVALDAFRQVWQSYPPLADYAAWEMAEYYADEDRLPALQQTVTNLAARYPLSRILPYGWLLVAETQQRLQQLTPARTTLERWLWDFPEHTSRPRVLAMLSEIHEEMGDLVAAARTWQRLGEEHPRDKRAAKALARSRELWGQMAPEQRPPFAPMRLLSSLDTLVQARRWPEVEARLATLSTVTQPADLVAAVMLQRGDVAVRRKRWAEASAALHALLHRYPRGQHVLETRALLAQVYQRQAAPEQSAQQYEQVLAHGLTSPWAARALLSLARYHQDRGDTARAMSLYQQLWQHFPKNELAQETLWEAGWEHYLAGNYPAAEGLWGAFTHYFPAASLVPRTRYWQARAAQHQGRQQDAVRLYQHILRDYPSHYYSAQASTALQAAGVPVILPPAAATVLQPPPNLTRLAAASTPEAQNRAHFHLIRAQELRQVGMPKRAAREIRVLATLLPDTPPTQYFLAGLLAENQRYLEVFRLLNPLVKTFRPAEVRSLPRSFWTLLYPRVFWDDIVQQARDNNLDPYLALSIMRQESAFNPEVVSSAGARGVMQLMPATARQVAQWLKLPKPHQVQLHEPTYNITLGTTYFARVLQRFNGNLVLALAGYNAGPTRASNWRQQWPDAPMDEFVERIPFNETRLYVKLILRNIMMYKRLYTAS